MTNDIQKSAHAILKLNCIGHWSTLPEPGVSRWYYKKQPTMTAPLYNTGSVGQYNYGMELSGDLEDNIKQGR
jgi:hypothetical protein